MYKYRANYVLASTLFSHLQESFSISAPYIDNHKFKFSIGDVHHPRAHDVFRVPHDPELHPGEPFQEDFRPEIYNPLAGARHIVALFPFERTP